MVRENRRFYLYLLGTVILLILIPLICLRVEYNRARQEVREHNLSECGTILTEEDSPQAFIAGVLAQEDWFYLLTDGVDFHQLIDSFFRNLRELRIARGGSTITMQVASLCYPSQINNSWRNKFREIIFAEALAKEYSKSEILRAYLTAVPLASDPAIIGFPKAAEYYFHKKIPKLTYDESWRLILTLRNRETLNPNIIKNLDQLNEEAKSALKRAQTRQKFGFVVSSPKLHLMQKLIDKVIFY